LAFTF